LRRRLLLAGLALALAAPAALAETQTENIVAEQRTSVSLRIAPQAAQALLPAGWVSGAAPEAANLTIVFMDRKLALTPEGKPLQAGVNRVMVLAMPARNAAGQSRNLIVGGYSADPLGVPGAYKVYGPGAVTIARSEKSATQEGKLSTTVEEHWEAKGADGASVILDLVFERGVPTLNSFEQKNYSGADPDFYRTYKGQQASEVLRNASGVDHVKAVRLKAAGGKLGKVIDGSEKILTISSAPFYSRLTFVP
jgi:hypothetical protein